MRKYSIMNDDKGIPRLALNDKPYFQKGLLDVIAFDLHGFLPEDALTLHHAAPKPVVVHVCLLAAGRRMRYNNKLRGFVPRIVL